MFTIVLFIEAFESNLGVVIMMKNLKQFSIFKRLLFVLKLNKCNDFNFKTILDLLLNIMSEYFQ